MILEINDLKEALEVRNLVKKSLNHWHDGADWETFQLAMRLLNPQSYGAHFEKRIRIAYGWDKNSAKDRIGDASYILDGKKINSEIKVSLTTDDNKNVNILQIRDSHGMDYYDIFVIHIDNKVDRFRLSKNQMYEELLVTGANLAHGTKGNDDGRFENAEYRIDFKATDQDNTYTRWKDNYLSSEFCLVDYVPFSIL